MIKFPACLASLLFVCASMLSSVEAIADVMVTTLRDKIIDVDILGNITPSDYLALLEKIASAKARLRQSDIVIWANLNSTGGDVETALKIGRFLRKERTIGHVQKNAMCASSCVFILAGAAARMVEGNVGIHRPFNPNATEASASGQKEKYRKLGLAIKGYLTEMNIPARLFDDMLYIGPDQIRVLNDNELRDYGLNANDPYWQEAADVRRAQALGITRGEYVRRTVRARTACGIMSESLPRGKNLEIARCMDEIERGKR